MKPKPKSFRMKFTFWLDVCREDENGLAEYIEELKGQRKFVTTIKQGLRLIRDLRAGNTTVLIELFPLVVERLRGQQDNSELVSLITAMMHNPSAAITPPRLTPAYDTVPVVAKVDEGTARERTIENTLAALADF